jgi:two-component system phosphate regulon sensor histidine kinase PhoR
MPSLPVSPASLTRCATLPRRVPPRRSDVRAAAIVLAAAIAAAVYGLAVLTIFFAVAAIVIFLLYRVAMPHKLSALRRPDFEAGGRGEVVSSPPVIERAAFGVDALGDPALVVGGDFRVVAANDAARALFGDRVVADDLRLVLRHPAVLDAVRVAASAPAPIEREVTGLGTNNGAYRVRVAALGPDLPGGSGVRLLVTFVDITQARLTERMRVDFIANASHELRTPVTTLLGFIETLQGPAAEDEHARHRFLEIMHREAARMSRLIDDLLSLSRIELDKHVRPQTALDVAPLIADVGRTLAMRLDADQRRLAIRIAEGLPAVVADRDQVLQVLHNLVSNALKYGRSGTAITVDADRVEIAGAPMVKVTIGDRGDGIAPEHLPRLTERFYRIDTSRSRSMGGTGLGLAIVKHIIERHRGGFEIVSVPGEGSQVSFTLPLASTDTTISRVAASRG